MANVIKHKRGSGSDPVASDLVVGEVAIRTDVGKLFTKMDNGSVAEIAGGGSDIAINTLSSSSGTGGGSATFNGSAFRFTLSAPPSVSAQQLLVSINGVIQKPVAGTGQPSEGFSVDGTDIILGDAPATGSDFFILTFKSLGVSEPADNSVTSAKIVDGTIVNADINASAAIAGSKISPNFGSQNIVTTGDLTIGDSIIHSGDTNTKIRFSANDTVKIETGGSSRFQINDNNIQVIDIPFIITRSSVAGNSDLNFGDSADGDTGQIRYRHDDNFMSFTVNTAERMRITSAGLVGIGTTSPSALLSLKGSQNSTLLHINDSSEIGHRQFTITSSSNGLIYTLNSQGSSGGVSGEMAFATQGTERMRINSSGRVLIGTTSGSDALVVDGGSDAGTITTNSTNSNGNVMTFNCSGTSKFFIGSAGSFITGNSGTTNQGIRAEGDLLFAAGGHSERMRITSSGNVGIGTTSPSTIFHVKTLNPDIFLENTGSGTGQLRLGHFTNGAFIGTYNDDGGGSDILRFGTHSGDERMRIDSSGRLLLGQTSGSSPLCVSGTNPVIAELHHSDGGTNDQARISLGALANNPPSNRGVNLIAENNGAGHDFVIACSASHSLGPSEKMRIRSDGFVGIGITGNVSSSTGKACFRNISDNRRQLMLGTTSQGNRALIEFSNSNGSVGSINTVGSNTAYNTSSDYRLKENVVGISDGITRLKTLKPSRFNFKSDATITVDGFLAHEVTAVPEAITGEKDAVVTQALVDSGDNQESELGNPIYQQIDQSKLVPLLVAALQEAIGRIEALEAK